MLEGMHHVAVIASNETKSLDFYVNKLGFTLVKETWRPEQQDYLRMLRLGDLTIELFICPNAPQRVTEPEALGLRHLAFRVTDIAAARDWLNGRGIETEPIRVDSANGGHYLFFRDPDNLPLELHD
jgi:glyoxylase I family protein